MRRGEESKLRPSDHMSDPLTTEPQMYIPSSHNILQSTTAAATSRPSSSSCTVPGQWSATVTSEDFLFQTYDFFDSSHAPQYLTQKARLSFLRMLERRTPLWATEDVIKSNHSNQLLTPANQIARGARRSQS
ncbi:hypothetical protein ElyMa_001158700 [Elysia marginata]|uniref:Uncharacterized protein n=1 Tax=Elysia marginata TaxID=1093978 RepID=A0AAV4I1M9_9GAST|nr:hypothetical protein ElyMa_001158700 [Elysia marginata]